MCATGRAPRCISEGFLVAKRISELAQHGERDPTRLREGVRAIAARLAAHGALSTPGNL